MKTIKKRLLTSVLCAAVLSTGLASTANATFESRLGGNAFYDTELGITWAANANINGANTWDNQQTWVSGLTIDGISGWRLARADANVDNIVDDCFVAESAGCSDNELGYMFMRHGITPISQGVFSNVQSGFYWTGTSYVHASTHAWVYSADHGGLTGTYDKTYSEFAWAVHSGDVGAADVPEPGTIALMGLGLVGLLGFGRRQRRR